MVIRQLSVRQCLALSHGLSVQRVSGATSIVCAGWSHIVGQAEVTVTGQVGQVRAWAAANCRQRPEQCQGFGRKQ